VSFWGALMVEIASDDWELYQEKFGDLISFIAQRITGDPMCCDYEENMQDLYIAAINSINGYYKKNNITPADMAVRDVIECPLFKQYTKTVLWNAKNFKGNKATKYKNFMPASIDMIDNKDDLVIDDTTNIVDTDDEVFNYFHNKFTSDEKELLSVLVANPDCIRENGKININALSKAAGKSFYITKTRIDSVQEKLNERLS
jgi:hypothetical protein